MSPCSWDIAVPGAPVGHSGLAMKSDKTEESLRELFATIRCPMSRRLCAPDGFQPEHARTQELILRHLPNPPATVIDAGGGAGVYACWLAALGYHVHRIDPVAKHGDQAFRASAAQPRHPSGQRTLGMRVTCNMPTAARRSYGRVRGVTCADRDDRRACLREAHRVLRPGGIVCGACIRGFASLLHS